MITFIFTDIENSTEKWKKCGKKMSMVLQQHDKIVTNLVLKFGGKVVKNTGDGIFAIFENGDPLNCAIEIEKAFFQIDCSEVGGLKIRVVLHSGEAEQRGDDYFGYDVNLASKMLDIGWGGQILLSENVVNNERIPDKAKVIYLGSYMLKGIQEPQKIYQLTHPDLELKDFLPLRTLGKHPNNLPEQTTEFIGRKEELEKIHSLLISPEVRLITLLGGGGMGKTRLALEIAQKHINEFPDGVYFVPLSSIDRHELIISSIANVLNVNMMFHSVESPLKQLVKFLKGKKMLLVMDNFEHVIDGATILTNILKEVSKVKFIVTSRIRLNIKGEWTFKLKGMRIDGESDAVLLFLSAAKRIDSSLEFSEEEIALVKKICSKVNGIPLGIELAVSWLKTLSVEEIYKEISRGFNLLETDVKGFSDRHKSFKRVLNYSWGYLISM